MLSLRRFLSLLVFAPTDFKRFCAGTHAKAEALEWHVIGAAAGLVMLIIFAPVQARADDAEASKAAFFQEHVLPLLEEKCFECHSHRSQTMKGGLALDYRSGWEQGGDSGPAIQPGSADSSLLVQAVRRQDGLEMPPDEPLTADQIQVIEQWVRDGAIDPRTTAPVTQDSDWWSLRRLERPVPPTSQVPVETFLTPSGQDASLEATSNPIDAFVDAKLRELALHAAPRADRRTLLRRLYVDMLGMPPTFEQVAAFEADTRPDAYERTVDRILASPAYGERWSRHWMDTIHFAESHGFEHDVARPNAWPYRDYLIARLNSDVPWSRFVREQLAADYFFPDQPQWTAALGFLGAGTFDISSFTTAPKTFAYLDRDDMVTQTVAALASTTVNCARCHTHKFDPVTQEDYFALQSVFAGLIKGDIAFDADAEVADRRRRLDELQKAAEARSADVLLVDGWSATVRKWEQAIQVDAARWKICTLATYEAAGGPQLHQQTDSSILASAPYPETAHYALTFQPPVSRLTAIRIEVMTDPSLPQSGPGAASNGNLHLSEIEAHCVTGANSEKQKLPFRNATADFEQEGWTAAHAIDGQMQTAWGIHPQESRPHAIVVELAQPLTVPADAKIELHLHQSHGRQHIIGRFRIAVSDQNDVRLAPLSDDLLAALGTAPEARNAEQKLLIAAEALRSYVAEEFSELPPATRVYAAGAEVLDGNGITAQTIPAPQPIHVLSRGDIDKPGRPIGPGALSVIKDLNGRFEIDPAASEAARRAALADWLVDPQNPLTWRSIANRLWHFHFGRGLCDTPSDFGRMGGEPSHPELLDWLASELRDEGESLKRLHRLIVTSRTYCKASEASADSHQAASAIDGENRWLWRQNRLRLDADAYRDAVLATSGRLDRSFGGPSVQQFSISPGQQLTPMLDYSNFDWNSAQSGRRSIYRFVWRGIADPFMEALDFPDLGLLAPQRAHSSSALQSLALYNNDFVLFHAQRLAERIEQTYSQRATDSPATDAAVSGDRLPEMIREAFRSTLEREPTAAELAMFRPLADQHGLPSVVRVIFNSNEFHYLD